MKLKLLEENNELLTRPSTPWDFIVDGDPTELVNNLIETLTDNGGIGLAAPQCGVMKNIFVMGNFTKMVACINPYVVETSEDIVVELEGCLSFPELWLKVKRPKSCTVQYQDVKGNVIEETLDGMKARVFLHELDHCYGLTFTERVASLSLRLAKEKRRRENKRKK